MTTLIYFSNNLRLHNNAVFNQLTHQCTSLLCVYIVDPRWFEPSRYNGLFAIGKKRWSFLYHSLLDLDQQLQQRQQKLHIIYDIPEKAIPRLIGEHNIERVISSREFGWQENRCIELAMDQVSQSGKKVTHNIVDTYTLLKPQDLPFKNDFPQSFSRFRKLVEKDIINNIKGSTDSLEAVNTLPPQPTSAKYLNANNLPACSNDSGVFSGGETHAKFHLADYFSGDFAKTYKVTRNALDGWRNSCKFSPWLACGSLSAKAIIEALYHYEQENGANESTQWIAFELLWREYFQWYANYYDTRLFSFRGISQQKPLTSFYPQRFRMWCDGNTPWPLVNACMKELNSTAYLSNRGRQIVASCLVNELGVDWRYGAAYFQQQLIDYDVAVNWGNWQYIAGVGADPRGGRHFNIDKQTTLYDPKHEYIDHWIGKSPQQKPSIDSVDAADWPTLG